MKGPHPADLKPLGVTGMKTHIAITIAAIAAAFFGLLAPASAQESDVSFLYQVRVQEPRQLVDIQTTIAPDELVREQLFLTNWNVSRDFSLALDVWNAEALDSDNQAVTDAVHETDLELEGTWRDVVNEWDFRVKAAIYEISGPEIYSVRFAADHPIGEHCTGTGSLELMQGAFDFGVLKGNVACRGTWRGWTGTAEAGVTYNTLNDRGTVPFMLMATYGETFSVGPYVRGYAGDRIEPAFGVQFALRH